uniref:Uncharacterized protein n=1 Tax=Anguilla anguilla TaxID=7936 RepID=A0A0E9WUY2_ANGAN
MWSFKTYVLHQSSKWQSFIAEKMLLNNFSCFTAIYLFNDYTMGLTNCLYPLLCVYEKHILNKMHEENSFV